MNVPITMPSCAQCWLLGRLSWNVQQACGVKRGTIFGFTLSDESIAMAASSSDASAEPAPKRVCRAIGEA